MTTTYSTALKSLLDQVRGLGLAFTVSASSGGVIATTTDPRVVSEPDETHWQGNILYIPDFSAAADQIRAIDKITVSGGTASITVLGSNYAESESSVQGYILATHPSELQNLANLALSKRSCEVLYPLMHGPADGFMEQAGTSAWDASSATVAKQTDDVLRGYQSMSVTDSGSGGQYAEQQTLETVGKGRTVYMHAVARAHGGLTNTLKLLDGSGNLQESVAFTQREWLSITKPVTLDSDDTQFKLRLEATTASAVGDWNGAWYVKQDGLNFELPSWLDHTNQLKALYYADYGSAGVETDTWLFRSQVLTQMVKDSDYDFYDLGDDVNQALLAIRPERRAWLQKQLWMAVQCKYSAPYGIDATFSSYDDTNPIPQDEFLEAWKIELAMAYNEPVGAVGRERYDKGPFQGLHSRALTEQKRLEVGRVTQPAKPLVWLGPTGGVRL